MEIFYFLYFTICSNPNIKNKENEHSVNYNNMLSSSPLEFGKDECKKCILKNNSKILTIENDNFLFLKENLIFKDFERSCNIKLHFKIYKVNNMILQNIEKILLRDKKLCDATYIKLFDDQNKEFVHLLVKKYVHLPDDFFIFYKNKKYKICKDSNRNIIPCGLYELMPDINGYYPECFCFRRYDINNPPAMNNFFYLLNSKIFYLNIIRKNNEVIKYTFIEENVKNSHICSFMKFDKNVFVFLKESLERYVSEKLFEKYRNDFVFIHIDKNDLNDFLRNDHGLFSYEIGAKIKFCCFKTLKEIKLRL